jgi:hypothetical protein
MGYRIRLGKVSKKEKQRFKGMTYEQAKKEIGYEESLYYPPFHTELYEIGKYVDFKVGRLPFYDFDIEKETDAEFDIITKEGLKAIIDSYHESTFKHYSEMLKPFERFIKNPEMDYLPSEEDIKEVVAAISRKVNAWKSEFVKPYWLDEERTDGEIVRSWSIEYAIFNLVYIYRTFDWENDYLIYSGW